GTGLLERVQGDSHDEGGCGGRRFTARSVLVTIFFFSSRRRHTRSYGDWSSDVCSSDLEECQCRASVSKSSRYASKPLLDESKNRSEERRVGKECRYRWAREQ